MTKKLVSFTEGDRVLLLEERVRLEERRTHIPTGWRIRRHFFILKNVDFLKKIIIYFFINEEGGELHVPDSYLIAWSGDLASELSSPDRCLCQVWGSYKDTSAFAEDTLRVGHK